MICRQERRKRRSANMLDEELAALALLRHDRETAISAVDAPY